MRGSDERTGELFLYVDIEERVPQNHPLRLIRRTFLGIDAGRLTGREQVKIEHVCERIAPFVAAQPFYEAFE